MRLKIQGSCTRRYYIIPQRYVVGGSQTGDISRDDVSREILCSTGEGVSRPSILTTKKYIHTHEEFTNTVELHLCGLIGTTSHPDMQKIRII